ncbi:MAG: hypothetical protein RR244_03180, partial [Oscillospiraceae bacterium]
YCYNYASPENQLDNKQTITAFPKNGVAVELLLYMHSLSIRLTCAFLLLPKLISITVEVWANLAIRLGLLSFFFHRLYVSIG